MTESAKWMCPQTVTCVNDNHDVMKYVIKNENNFTQLDLDVRESRIKKIQDIISKDLEENQVKTA